MSKQLLNFYGVKKGQQEEAVKMFEDSTFDMLDIVVSLLDIGLAKESTLLTSVFENEVFLALMNAYTCNFKAIKKILGINGEYVERNGNPKDTNFIPKRNAKVLSFKAEEMQERAKKVYDELILEINEETQKLSKLVENN